MKNKQEQGQIFVLLVVSLIGLLAIVGLGVDSARIFIEKRRVQNAVDNAALAGALSLCTSGTTYAVAKPAALTNATSVLTSYGYTDNGIDDEYDINNPFDDGDGTTDNDYVFSVTLKSIVDPIIIQIVYQGEVAATAEGIAYCKLVQEAVFNKAVYSLGGGCSPVDFKIAGSSSSITGGFHSESDVQIQSQVTLDGNSTYVDGSPSDSFITYVGSTSFGSTSAKNPALPYDIDDFKPSEASGSPLTLTDSYGDSRFYYNMGSGTVNYSDFTAAGYIDGGGNISDGVYFVDGDFKINGLMIGTATFVATGEIQFNGGNGNLLPYYDGLIMAFANTGGSLTCNKGISFSGSNNAFNGLMYAPFGQFSTSGSSNGTSIEGLIVAAAVSITGSSSSITYNTAYEPPPPPTVGILK